MAPSTIKETLCFDEIHRATSHLSSQSLVIFDIDDVLFTATDHILKPPHRDHWLNTHFDEKFLPEVALDLLGHTWTTYDFEPTDPKVAELNNTLKERNIPSIALTAGWNGKLAHRPSHCDDRIRMLQSVHMNFTHSFPHMPETFFHGLHNCGKIPSFKSGVIFACMISKPVVLDAFLKSARFHPKDILFVDDMHHNLVQMQEFCTKENIAYQGFHYTAVSKRNHKILDEALALFQIETLIRDRIWLSDENAREKMHHLKMKNVG